MKTQEKAYSDYLFKLGSVWWKRVLNPQILYQWNLRRLRPGFTLDIGCGLGRNLITLGEQGVGIDHNPEAIEIAKTKGLQVFTLDQFSRSKFSQGMAFDTLLFSHVLEHLSLEEAVKLLGKYLELLKPQGKVIIFTPQESGFQSDPTHRKFLDFNGIRALARGLALLPHKEYSFPFPRFFGKFFKYNEFISVYLKRFNGLHDLTNRNC